MRTPGVGLVVVAALVGPRLAVGDGILPEAVRQSMQHAGDYLLQQQQPDGTWPDWPGHPGGVTALCTLALLESGLEPANPQIQAALDCLRYAPLRTTYAISLQIMALCAAEPQRDGALIERLARDLAEVQVGINRGRGGWAYPTGSVDSSNTQFALLALHEAERAGATIAEETWREALDYWKRNQRGDGAWGYQGNSRICGSMTCAGISSVSIIESRLDVGDARVVGGRVECCVDHKPETMIVKATAWMNRNFAPEGQIGRGEISAFYYLYSVERAGRLTALQFFGDHDWYREGVELLVNTQMPSGAWPAQNNLDGGSCATTAMALLFLSKGRRPVVVGKLVHRPDGDWNRHRRDVANLVAHTEGRWQRDLCWYVVDPNATDVDNMARVPVLFLNGRLAPSFSDAEFQMLREYIERGGFLLAEGCCGSGGFDNGFRAFLRRAFPESELRPLEPEHPAWNFEREIPAKFRRPLWGLEVACRTSVIYCPEDLSCYWELARFGYETRLEPEIRDKVEAVCDIGTNILAYATGRELKYKYEFVPTPADPEPAPAERVHLAMARVRHGSGADAAPDALAGLNESLAREVGLHVSFAEHDVGMTDESLFDYPVLYLHGNRDFRLSDAERAALRTYVARGGFVLASSVCSSGEFTQAFRREMAATFSEAALERIAATHAIFTPHYGGFSLETVQLRKLQREAPDRPFEQKTSKTAPLLEGIPVEGRYGVVFSPIDLSCAIQSKVAPTCTGYIHEDATRIAINCVLYAVHE